MNEELTAQLKNKRICRFCLSVEEPLSNIYSAENRLKSRAPLPLQIMACVSIEVFTNDGLPVTICDFCRLIMDHSYRFKQMCKKADTTLKQFPLTGVWPEKLELPAYPEELLKNSASKIIKSPIKREPSPNATSKAAKRRKLSNNAVTKVEVIDQDDVIVSPPPGTYNTPLPVRHPIKRENIPAQTIQMGKVTIRKITNTKTPAAPNKPHKPLPTILNKNMNKQVKILNKNAPSNANAEPVLKRPVFRTNERGTMELVTEILEKSDDGPDPIKFASPVETNVYPCEYCERSFPLRQLLDIHMTNHSRERKFHCEICDKSFFSKYDLGKHNLIHSGEKPFICVVCNKTFSRSTLLFRHQKIHTDQPKLLCIYCERTFLSQEELDKHSERHNKSRPFPCLVCNKNFAFKQGLERHEVIHSKEQPYKCEHCDKSFSTPNKLARHLTAHAGRRPFPCRLCPKSYLLSHHLTRHVRSHRDASGSYKCYDCTKVCASQEELIYHSAVHATQSLTCPLCKEHFKTLADVTVHIKSHTEGEQFACEFCDLIFTTDDKLEEHSHMEHSEEQAVYENDNKTRIVKKEIEYNIIDDDASEFEPNDYEVILPDYENNDEGTVIEELIIEDTAVKPNRNSQTLNKAYNNFELMESFDLAEQGENELELLTENEADDLVTDDLTYYDDVDNENGQFTLPPEEPVTNRTKDKTFRAVDKQTVTIKQENIQTPKKLPVLHKVALNSLPKGITIKKNPLTVQPPAKSATKSTPPPAATTKAVTRSTPPAAAKRTDQEKTAAQSPKASPEQTVNRTYNAAAKQTYSRKPEAQKTRSATPSGPKAAQQKPFVNVATAAAANAIQLLPIPIKQLSADSKKKITEMKIGDDTLKVHRVKMTKAQVAEMTKRGQIEMKDGVVFLKKGPKSKLSP